MAKREAEASASAVSQARAGESSAKVMLGYATIVAPFAGVVTARYVDPGDSASPGVPVIAVEDHSLYRLEASVAARYEERITEGTAVGLELGDDKRRGEGHVALVTPASDPSTRSFTVKVNIPESMKPDSGDFGRVSFPVGHTRAILVPSSAIHDQGGILNVYVAGSNNRTDMRIVRVGRRIDGKVEILTGLQPGDRVITWSSAPLDDDVPFDLEETR
jgi:RND family efflux transporter MFP subunit